MSWLTPRRGWDADHDSLAVEELWNLLMGLTPNAENASSALQGLTQNRNDDKKIGERIPNLDKLYAHLRFSYAAQFRKLPIVENRKQRCAGLLALGSFSFGAISLTTGSYNFYLSLQ